MSPEKSKSDLAASQVPCEHVIFTNLDGLEGVLVDLNTKKYYELNETASLIWRGLEKHLSAMDIAAEMTDRYDVTLEKATANIETVLSYFQTHNLVRSQ